MPEETTDVSTDTTSTDTQPAFIDTDGNLLEGWREHYVDEGDRGEQVFDRATTLQGVFKSLASSQRMIGKDKIAIPNENSGDDEWAAWNKAHGMPELATDYTFTLPEGIEPDIDRQKGMSELFHSLGLNQKQVDGLVTLDLAQQEEVRQTSESRQETEMLALKEQLLSEWGNAYEQKKHLGNMAIEQGVKGESAEFKARVVEKYGNDPDLIKVLSNLGSKFSEHGIVPSTVIVADTPAQVQEKITELMHSDAYNNKTHANHKNVMAQVQQLFKEKHTIRQPA